MNPTDLISAKQARKRYGYRSTQVFRTAASRGTIKEAMRSGRRVWYSVADIERAIAAGRMRPGLSAKKRVPVDAPPVSAADPRVARVTAPRKYKPRRGPRALSVTVRPDFVAICKYIGAHLNRDEAQYEIAARFGLTGSQVQSMAHQLRKAGLEIPEARHERTTYRSIVAEIKREQAPRMSTIG